MTPTAAPPGRSIMRTKGPITFLAMFAAGLTISAFASAADFIESGSIELAPEQIGIVSDGFNLGEAWEALFPLSTPITLNPGDSVQGTIDFGNQVLRVRDNGEGFFVIGNVGGFEQLIVLGDAGVPLQISAEDNSIAFTGVQGPILQNGASRVGNVNHGGMFMQASVDMVAASEEFTANGIVYKLGLVSGGPFTLDELFFRVLAEELGVSTCGDGVVNNAALEECDDGNNVDGDGCSSVCAVEPIEALENLRDFIDALDPADFSKKNAQKTLINKINAILNELDLSDVASVCAAIDKLADDLLPKTDGLSPPPDWLTDMAIQEELADRINAIIDALLDEADALGGCL